MYYVDAFVTITFYCVIVVVCMAAVLVAIDLLDKHG